MKSILILLLALFSLSSCKSAKEKNPDVVKYEEQKVELEALEAELIDLRIKTAELKTKGPKVSVEELGKKLEEKEAELEKLNAEFALLEESQKAAVDALAKLKEQMESQ